MKPDRVVVGVDSDKAQELMTNIYRPLILNNFRVIFMDIPSAEMTKYASNAVLVTRIRRTHAEAIFHVREWKEFRLPNREVIKRSIKPNPVLFNGRNVFDKTMLDGIEYLKIG